MTTRPPPAIVFCMRRLLTCGIAVLVLSAGLLLDYAALAPAAQTSAVDVAAIQERLAELGYLPLSAVDGSLNARTRQAIIAFQGWQGLDRTGAAGPATLARLETAARPRPVAGSGPRIEIDLDRQVALLVRGQTVERAIHVSTGASGTRRPRRATSTSTERRATRGRFRSPCGCLGPATSRAVWPSTATRTYRRIPPPTVACAFPSRRRRLSTRSPNSEFRSESCPDR
jgi:hypothetical protein